MRQLAPNGQKSSIRRQIDENLRRVYQETLPQDMPDRLADLLARLQAQREDGNDRGA